jgi:flagella basal body P-ring formation protein FlgA
MKLSIALLVVMLFPGFASAEQPRLFPVPIVTLQPGDPITDSVLMERRLIASDAAARSHHTGRDTLVGQVARRVLPKGQAIALNATRRPHVFSEGARVAIEFASGGLRIRGYGTALEAGIAGEPVRIRNIDSGIILSGLVRADGTVEVGSQ